MFCKNTLLKFVKKDDGPDISFRRVGIYAGNIDTQIKVLYSDNKEKLIKVKSRIDTDKEINYFKHDGILPFVLSSIS